MAIECPKCRQRNVRSSHSRKFDHILSAIGLVPYRCTPAAVMNAIGAQAQQHLARWVDGDSRFSKTDVSREIPKDRV